MPLAPATLLVPKGPVTLAVLGSALGRNVGTGDASVALESYVEAAYDDARVAALTAGTTRDAGARAFALWRIYSDALQGMLDRPQKVDVDEKGGHAYSDKQLAAMQDKVAQYAAELEDAVTPVAVVAPVVRGTSAPVCVSW